MIYYIFESPYSYCNYMCKNFESNSNVVLLKPNTFGNFFFFKLLYMSSLKMFHKNIFHWPIIYYSFFNFKKIILNKDLSFCFFDSCFLVRDKSFLKWLKNKFPTCKIIVLIVNHIGDNNSLVTYYNDTFDFVFTFDKYDSNKYNLKYFEPLAPRIDIKELTYLKDNVYDLGIIVRDKGRYQPLKNLYIRLSKNGFKCLFYVISDMVPVDEIDKEIIHKEFLDFKKVIELEYQCKCLLDYNFVDNGDQGYSLRLLDAFQMNKYIVTNNKRVKDFKGYNDNYIKIIDDLSEVDLNFVLENKKPHYEYVDIFYGNDLLETIKDLKE